MSDTTFCLMSSSFSTTSESKIWRIFVQKDRPRSRYYFDCKPIVNRILCSGHIRPPPATILDPIWTTWVFGTSILCSCSTNSHRFEKFLIRYCKWYSIIILSLFILLHNRFYVFNFSPRSKHSSSSWD